MTEQLVLNPQSKRYVKFGSSNHKRLIREGILPAVDALPAPKPKPSQLVEKSQQEKMDMRVIENAVQVVVENKNNLKGLSQQESDELISRLLYERLCMVPSKKLVGRPIKTSKPVKPSVIQRPISMRQKKRQEPSSEDSDDDVSIASNQIETTDNPDSDSDEY